MTETIDDLEKCPCRECRHCYEINGYGCRVSLPKCILEGPIEKIDPENDDWCSCFERDTK